MVKGLGVEGDAHFGSTVKHRLNLDKNVKINVKNIWKDNKMKEILVWKNCEKFNRGKVSITK